MVLHLSPPLALKQPLDTLVIPVCEDADIHYRSVSSLQRRALAVKEFKGRKGDVLTLYDIPRTRLKRVMYMGLGKKETLGAEAFRAMAAAAVKRVIDADLDRVWLVVPSAAKSGLKIDALLPALMEGALLANHRFDRYKGKKEHQVLSEIHLVAKPSEVMVGQGFANRVETICQASLMARQWVDTPSNDKRPEPLAAELANAGRDAGLSVQVMDEHELKALGFGALLAVSTGSANKPAMVVFSHRGSNAAKTIALVGKGVTFDSGGLNLKRSDSIEAMKIDMAGAAVVAATMIAAARLKFPVNLVAALPLVENMPSGTATRPGDIVQSVSAKTVEIGNTDAEGRLILADAISWVIGKHQPDLLIDLATLTGACVVALGEKIAGVFSRNDRLAETLVAAGNQTHERCWRMPLPEDYRELIKSEIADIRNMSSSKWGGAITAALFLSEFVGETPWAHIDIAGPSFTQKATPYGPPGATGFGVRLLCEFLLRLKGLEG